MVRLRPLRTGTVAMPRAYTYRGEWRGRIDAPIGAFLLEHPGEGPLLVDTGWDPRADVGRAMGLFFRGVRMDPADAVPARLDAWGVPREAVRTVVMTHLHVDHTCAMPAFPATTFVIARAEWEAAHARRATLRGYVGEHLPAESSVRFADLAEPWEGFERTLDLLGDGSIRLLSTPGHSAGHLSVLVQAERGPVLLVGDAVYTVRNLREDRLPLLTADDAASRDSMRRLRAFAEAHPDVALIPTHDAAAWDALDAA